MVAWLVVALLCCCLIVPQFAGAKTVLEVYEKLKGEPEYQQLIQDLVATGKVTEAEIDAFVADVSSRIPADVTRENFEEEFYSAAVSAISNHPHVLDAVVEKYGWDVVLNKELPPSLEDLKDAFLREMFSDEGGSGGGGGGGTTESGGGTTTGTTGEQPQEPPAPPSGQTGVETEAVTFADVQGHWAQQDIEFMAARGVIKGVGNDIFAPDQAVTRAQFACMLVRALGIADAAPTGKAFSDVPADAWYAGAVEAAFNRGLVGGMGDGSFAPDALITREQMAVMIRNALRYLGKGVSVSEDQMAALPKVYTDFSAVSGWAKQALAEMVQMGIIKGRSLNALAPQGKATRAEAVVMLRHLLETAGLV